MPELLIHPKFSKALRPLMNDEHERLDASIQSEGCHTPLMSWNGYIIDGHNRYEICRADGQSFKVTDRTSDFDTERDVLTWIFDNALAGRNLDSEDKREYIGELYNLLKLKDSERTILESDKMSPSVNTAKTLGEKFGVSDRTVKRYGSELERKKLLEELAEDIRKKASSEGWDEDRMHEKFEEASQDYLEPDDDLLSQESFSDDSNQDEPTDEQIAERRATLPKRSQSKSKDILGQQKVALRAYSSALDKIQGLRCDILFNGELELPVFATLYASIEVERKKFPEPKKKFG